MLGLNLGLNDPSNARQLASAAIEALPPGAIDAFEVGNEPDLFTKPRTFHVGRHLQRRVRQRSTYGFDTYVGELDRYLAALAGVGAPFAAGGFAGREWSSRSGELLGRTKGRVEQLSVHSYRLQTCGRQRKRPPSELIARLLGSRGAISRIGRLATAARRHGVSMRVSEANSAICGGVAQVSNTFASALWGTDALFGFLKAGATSVNMHTWTGAWYAPVVFHDRAHGKVAFVRPLFYGMLLFAKATANRARLVRAHWRGHDAVRVWATREANGRLNVVLLNVDPRISRKVRVRIPGVSGHGRIERMTAGSLGAVQGVKLGGRSYGRRSTTGELRGKSKVARVRRDRGVHTFNLPAASGVLLTVG